MIPALVLTAGLATRLRPLSLVRAKAAVPVAGEALARRILRRLAAAGVTDAVLNLHHLPHTLSRVVGDGSDLAIRVRYSWETPVLGSAGGPRHALPLLGASTFLIVNGDTLTDVALDRLVAAHRASGALVTMAVAPNPDPGRYGGVLVDARGVVTGFSRRAPDAAAPARGGGIEGPYLFVGVQVAEAEAFAALEDGTPAESVAALYPSLMRERPDSVRAYISPADFLDIGTPQDYVRTSLQLAGRERDARVTPARVDVTARVEASILWDDVEVGPGATLHGCVVTDGVRVPPYSSWRGVTMRTASGDLASGERLVDGLAIWPL